MKSTNTRKNRGKKSRNFKNTKKGGKRNKVVFIRKKTLRGKKKYTRRNRWKKNIHRGRQFLDVMVGGAADLIAIPRNIARVVGSAPNIG